jgi:hypothetical protein
MFFDIWSVISLYENELKHDPYGFWGINKSGYMEIDTNKSKYVRKSEAHEYAGKNISY